MDRRSSPSMRIGRGTVGENLSTGRTPSPRGRGRGRSLSVGRGKSPLTTTTKDLKTLLTPPAKVTPGRASRSMEQKKTTTPSAASPAESPAPSPHTEGAIIEAGKVSVGKSPLSRGSRVTVLKGSSHTGGSNADSQSDASDAEDGSRRPRSSRAAPRDSSLELSDTESLVSPSVERKKPGRKPGPKSKQTDASKLTDSLPKDLKPGMNSDAKSNVLGMDIASDLSDAESLASDVSRRRGRSTIKNLMEIKLSKSRDASIDSSDAESKNSDSVIRVNARASKKQDKIHMLKSRDDSIDSSDAESVLTEVRRKPGRPFKKQPPPRDSSDADSPVTEVRRKPGRAPQKQPLQNVPPALPDASGDDSEADVKKAQMSTSGAVTPCSTPDVPVKRKPGRPFKNLPKTGTFKTPPSDEIGNKPAPVASAGESESETGKVEKTKRKSGKGLKSQTPHAVENDKGTPNPVKRRPWKKMKSPSPGGVDSDGALKTPEALPIKAGRPFKSPPPNAGDSESETGLSKVMKSKAGKQLKSPVSSDVATKSDTGLADVVKHKTGKQVKPHASKPVESETDSAPTKRKPGRPFRSPPPSRGESESNTELSDNPIVSQEPEKQVASVLPSAVQNTSSLTPQSVKRKPGRPFKSPQPNVIESPTTKMLPSDSDEIETAIANPLSVKPKTAKQKAKKQPTDASGSNTFMTSPEPVKKKPGRPFKSPPPSVALVSPNQATTEPVNQTVAKTVKSQSSGNSEGETDRAIPTLVKKKKVPTATLR